LSRQSVKDVAPVDCFPHFSGDDRDGVGRGEVVREMEGAVFGHEDAEGDFDGEGDEAGL
jgi:hypothetical protein